MVVKCRLTCRFLCVFEATGGRTGKGQVTWHVLNLKMGGERPQAVPAVRLACVLRIQRWCSLPHMLRNGALLVLLGSLVVFIYFGGIDHWVTLFCCL